MQTKYQLTTILTLFIALYLPAQAGKYTLTAKPKEALFEYSLGDQGVWIEMRPQKIGLKTDARLIKLKPDLSGIDWETEIELGNESPTGMLDRQGGYAYFYDIRSGGAGFGKSRAELVQVSPNGKVTRKDNDDKALNKPLLMITDKDNLYSFWSKDGSDNIAVVIYKHQGLTKTTQTFDLGKLAKDGYHDWTFSGMSSTGEVSFARYGKTESVKRGTMGMLAKHPAEGNIEIATFEVKTGKLMRSFIYQYKSSNPVIAPASTDRSPTFAQTRFTPRQVSGLFSSDIMYVTQGKFETIYYNENAFGSLVPSEDGSGYYFSATINYKGHKTTMKHLPNPEGFYVEKLDLKGKSLWVATEKFSAKEVANMSNVAGTNRISIEQGIVPGEIAVSFKTATNKVLGWKYNLVYKVFDSNGKLLRSSLIQEKTVVDISEDKIKLTEKNVDELTSPTNPELQKAHRAYLLKHGCKNRLAPTWYSNAVLECTVAEQKGVFQFAKIVAE